MSQKVIALLEELLKEVKAHGCGTAAAVPAPQGNRTPAVMDYDGSDDLQNLVDMLRRVLRYERTGKRLSAKERNLIKRVIKDIKDETDVLNTNGHDIWTLNGL